MASGAGENDKDLWDTQHGGYATESDTASNNQPGFQTGVWGGDRGQYHYDANGRPIVDRAPGWQQDVDRFRGMADQYANRGAYQADYSDFQYGQGQARGALDLQRNAAMGNAPSAAEIAGKAAMEQQLAGTAAIAAGARGGAMQQAAAMRVAQRVNAQQGTQMQQQIQAGRANEMAVARGQYAQGSLAYGQNALGQTAQQTQNEQFQRQLNQQGQQWGEGMGWNTKQAALNADLKQADQSIDATRATNENDVAQQNATSNRIGAWANINPIHVSDARAKVPATVGDARTTRVATKGQAPEWLREAQQRYEARQELDRQAQAGHYTGDIIRRNPYEDDPKLDAALDARQGQTIGRREDLNPAIAGYMEHEGGRSSINRDDPYARPAQRAPIDVGAAGAPRGYAASRRGQEGYMFGPAAPSGSEDANRDRDEVLGLAPGSSDYDGANRARQIDGEWVALSDDRTKLQAAFRDGVEHAQAKETPELPAYFSDKDKERSRNAQIDAHRAGVAARQVMERKEIPRADARGPAQPAGPYQPNPGLPKYQPNPGAAPPPPPSRLQSGMPGRHIFLRAISDRARATAAQTAADDEASFDQRRAAAEPQVMPANVRTPTGEYKEGWEASSDERAKNRGDAHGDMLADAAHAMRSDPYAYKEGFTPSEQAPGELNYGPMAQRLEKNPLTATAVKEDPNGLKKVDMTKLVKVQSGLIDHLQSEIDEIKGRRRSA